MTTRDPFQKRVRPQNNKIHPVTEMFSSLQMLFLPHNYTEGREGPSMISGQRKRKRYTGDKQSQFHNTRCTGKNYEYAFCDIFVCLCAVRFF